MKAHCYWAMRPLNGRACADNDGWTVGAQSDGDIVQRMGGSFAILVIAGAFTQAAPIAVGAATFPFWGPLVQATARNLPVREFSCCGLWFANVYEVDWQPNPSQMYRNRRVASYRRSKPQWLISVTLGDDSGARAQVDLEVGFDTHHVPACPRNVRVP